MKRVLFCSQPALVGWLLLLAHALPLAAASKAPDGWHHAAPREEVAPKFTFDPAGGPSGGGSFVIESDGREGLIGHWTKIFPVHGGQTYRFSAQRRVENVDSPRRCAVARLLWRDASGNSVRRDQPSFASYRPGTAPIAAPEFPRDEISDGRDNKPDGWTEVSDTYRAPSRATQAEVELGFRWAAGGKVKWSVPSFIETNPRPPPHCSFSDGPFLSERRSLQSRKMPSIRSSH